MAGVSAPLGGGEIRAYLTEVADLLEPGDAQSVVVLVGGALLAWHHLRGSTYDVDSLRRLDDRLRAAAAEVAARHDLDLNWLNDGAAGYQPVHFDESTCEVLLERPGLLVLGAPDDQVFLMKLSRFDAQDREDMILLWPRTGFVDADEVVERFYEGYPLEPRDPHLAELVQRAVIAAAEYDGHN